MRTVIYRATLLTRVRSLYSKVDGGTLNNGFRTLDEHSVQMGFHKHEKKKKSMYLSSVHERMVRWKIIYCVHKAVFIYLKNKVQHAIT